jgi:cbb3-type cytochrome oxidase subunit 3
MSFRKKLFLILLLIIQLGIIWPVYTFFDEIYPMILGLPLSFAWIVAMLLSAFFLLLWYYLSDPEHKNTKPQHEAPTS